MFENSYSILDLLGWLFVGIAIGACILYFALWVYAVRRASGLTKRPPDGLRAGVLSGQVKPQAAGNASR